MSHGQRQARKALAKAKREMEGVKSVSATARKRSAMWYQTARESASVKQQSKPIIGKEALVQCWYCSLAETRKVGIGRPEELRCSLCDGEVEVLEVMDR